jgi:2-succinyl-5-enolpyruvyl-6-hydroxy-3-cyclohexene-1-carboxylate synthase
LIEGARRPVIVAGRNERYERGAMDDGPGTGDWPLLADPMSGLRRGRAAIAHYDALLRHPPFAESMKPDLVLRVGDLPVSKPLRTWLAGLGDVPQVALDPVAAWQDPDSVLCASLEIEPEIVLGWGLPPAMSGQEWFGAWRRADHLAAGALREVLGGEELSEPGVAAELSRLREGQATLFVASSMPVRDVETVWPVLDAPARVLCNRGANGIDGTVSSAFGAAAAAHAASGGEQVVLLIGDVALAHDIGGLLAAERLGLKLTIVLINNNGGGIFDFLPVARAPLARPAGEDLYTRHVATPTGLDFERAAALYELEHERVDSPAGFRAALERALARPGSGIIEVPSERGRNVEVHRRMWDAVAAALSR